MQISINANRCEPSPMRKFHPLAVAAKKEGKKIYHLNIGQPDLPTPEAFYQAVHDFADRTLEYEASPGRPIMIDAVKNYYGKLGVDLEETLATIADYYSANYGEDGIHVSLYTDYSYVLDGIYGATEAGSIGKFTKELTADGAIYTMTEDETGKTFTFTVGATVTLNDGSKTYPMLDKDPTAEKAVVYTFTGLADGWFAVTINCYDDGSFELAEGMADGSMTFVTAAGTYEFAADWSKFTFTFEDGSVLECPTVDYSTWSGEYTLLTVGYTSVPAVTVAWSNAG